MLDRQDGKLSTRKERPICEKNSSFDEKERRSGIR
jgi:hypothetical protein